MTGSKVTEGYTERVGGTVMINLHGRFSVGDDVAVDADIYRISSFVTTHHGEDWAVLVSDNRELRPLVVAASELYHAKAERRFEVGKYYAVKSTARKDGAYRVVHITEKGTVFMVAWVSEEFNYEIVDVTTTQSRDSYVEVRLEGKRWLPVSS